ncbi:aromatic ring-hydroxylating dioxygenase subunit alpha [Streptomyces buecherae]|uniref:aromatic ring-hydroxylating oxygenase subunit alpha n=1 Tax=Streptomyces buecherae TaxID=2763006 RepID=UPI00369F5D84
MSRWRRRERDPRDTARAPSPDDRQPVLPYPNGWFAVATSGEVRPGRVLTRRLKGEDVVLYRTTSGRLSVVRPFCPHLGAHLGHGGTVRGDNLVCPFHQFQFDPEGTCVRTAYGTPPPKARLATLDFREVDDLVFVWSHAEGRAPQWEVETLLGPDYPAPHCTPRSLLAHPQDVLENFVDIGHFGPLHGLSLSVLGDPVYEGHHLKVAYGLRPAGAKSGKRYSTLPTMRLTIEGLGAVLVAADDMKFGFDLRARICVTPVDINQSDLRVSVALRPTGAGRRRVARVAATLAPKVFARAAAADTKRDAAIWAYSRYQEQPRLAQGDGPIMPFRRWARQFYGDPAQAPARTG